MTRIETDDFTVRYNAFMTRVYVHGGGEGLSLEALEGLIYALQEARKAREPSVEPGGHRDDTPYTGDEAPQATEENRTGASLPLGEEEEESLE